MYFIKYSINYFHENYSLMPHSKSNFIAQSSSSATPKLSPLSGVKYPYQLVLGTVEGIPIPSHPDSKSSTIYCALHVSLFDLEHGSFFGKTWKSDPFWMSNASEQASTGGHLNTRLKNFCCFMHTSLNSTHIVAVIEFVFSC